MSKERQIRDVRDVFGFPGAKAGDDSRPEPHTVDETPPQPRVRLIYTSPTITETRKIMHLIVSRPC